MVHYSFWLDHEQPLPCILCILLFCVNLSFLRPCVLSHWGPLFHLPSFLEQWWTRALPSASLPALRPVYSKIESLAQDFCFRGATTCRAWYHSRRLAVQVPESCEHFVYILLYCVSEPIKTTSLRWQSRSCMLPFRPSFLCLLALLAPQEGSGDSAHLKAGFAMPWWIFIQSEETIYYCKYKGSSRLGGHSFERFGLQGFATFDAQQALTPASAPPDNTTAPAAPARALDASPNGFRRAIHGFECVFIPSQAFDTRSNLTLMGRKLELWPPSSGPLPIWRPGSVFLYCCCSRRSSHVYIYIYIYMLLYIMYVLLPHARQRRPTPQWPLREPQMRLCDLRSLRKFASSICEVPFDMDGEFDLFLEAGGLLLDYHAPTMLDDAMHACMHV